MGNREDVIKMSFSSGVKEELTKLSNLGRHCYIAETAAITGLCGEITVISKDRAIIKLQTENYPLVKKYFTLLHKAFNISLDVRVRRTDGKSKVRTYMLITNDELATMKLLQSMKMVEVEDNQVYMIENFDTTITESLCCKKAFIRGAFLATGSIINPEKNYHMEIVCPNNEIASYLKDLIQAFEIEGKIVKRNKYYVVYLKEGAYIVDLLNVIQAHVALMDLENVRIVKEIKNALNRKVNCEAANIIKTVTAAMKYNEDIEYIRDTVGLDYLSEQLEEVARLRLAQTELSLKELGLRLNPSVGKSGVNHRLRKISAIAQQLRDESEVSQDD